MKKEKQKSRNPYGLEYDLRLIVRTNDDKYELLSRLSHGLPSLQKVIDGRLFGGAWEKELDDLRRKQRAKGIDDNEFLNSKRRKELGLPVKTGRRTLPT